MESGHVVNQQTQPAVSFIELTLVVAGAANVVGTSPIGDAIRTTRDTITLAVAA
ncbi:hypothetical protein K1T35_18070 [Pseudonocardia sp. DSM 110487]|jgi:hypothetical protein|uniref:hypothetical protein n=1 Tax=Pseudonocardia sp. DSM 110487 TaxID=2865833 RepID=UPI001C69A323|nr:hypothetical protein [Pseudonocardia sp. DSM 110487]QYN38938.1 hypothetical protein K1T35_18070 [Pseudonocardia sp. DSM 110487]